MAAIVMYRGLMRDKRHWEGFQDHLQNKLSGRHQVYAFDTLGNGELNKEASPLQIGGYLPTLAEQLSQIEQKQIYLLGLSMGGMLLLELAAWLQLGRNDSDLQVAKGQGSSFQADKLKLSQDQAKVLALLTDKQFCGIAVINASAANLSPWYARFQLKQLLTGFSQRLKGHYVAHQPRAIAQVDNSGIMKNAHEDRLKVTKQQVIKPLNTTEATVLAVTSTKYRQSGEIIARWSEYRKAYSTGLRNGIRQLIACNRFKAQAFNLPLTVLNGLDDKLVNPSCSAALASYYNVPLQTFEHAGHDLSLDSAEALSEMLLRVWQL
ncbi:alpha/beta fold hydrolase [Shewanella halifaxensis]|uniref:alpha/beta fold hydrolase n=1 Tax=Shewanella halifaxensis TaxID=271098 RepID=UPI000D59B714|nr:alpha/beta hydrolase [Shewanella halifaxensis]